MLSNVHWAFEERCLVLTDYGSGVQTRRRALDLVLPTGALTLGFSEDGKPAPTLTLPPGRYPVYFSTHEIEGEQGQTHRRLLFVRVVVRDETPARWEPLGSYFTDGGQGILFDASLLDRYTAKAEELGWRALWELRQASLDDEPQSALLLDDASGGNALLFETDDTDLPLMQGLSEAGETVCALVAVYTESSAG